MSFSRQQRMVVAGGIVALVVWIVVLLHDDGSVLSILVRRVPSYMGWAPDSTTTDVLRRMWKYEKKGRYDDAIKSGIAWTKKYPDAGSNGWIYTDVSALYLKKASKDDEHAEEDVTQALLYRDKHFRSQQTVCTRCNDWRAFPSPQAISLRRSGACNIETR